MNKLKSLIHPSLPKSVSVFLYCLQCTVVDICICLVTPGFWCRPNRVSKPSVQLANRAIYLCDNGDHINQGQVFFYVFHTSSLPLSLMASSQKFQLDPPFSTGKYIKVVHKYRPTDKSLDFAILPLYYASVLKKNYQVLINSTHSIGPLIRNQALRTLA